MKTSKMQLLLAASGLLFSTLAVSAPLQSYSVDKNKISVSGLSSGGFMAVQLHVAFSKTFMGVGTVAGGVYHCAEGSQTNATGRCMDSGSIPSGNYFANQANSYASNGEIDPTSNLNGDRVYIFSGANDSVVRTASSDRARDFYENFTASGNIMYSRNQVPAEHAMPTTNYGNACGYKGDPYINDCNEDTAGEILNHIYPGLNGKVAQKTSNLKEFDQSPLSSSFYVGSTGYIYVPDACEVANANCKLHVVLHGCVQNKDNIGDQYAKHTGYNEWAESNKIIVVYPQTSTSATNSCWDWWGYADLITSGEYEKKTGVHMKFVKAVVDTITGDTDDGNTGGGSDSCVTSTNAQHASAGRATELVGYFYGKGSWNYLGNNANATTSLEETSANNWVKVSSCP